MKRIVNVTRIALTALTLTALGLMFAGCGSSGGESSSQSVSGTAAVGAPMAGQVSLKDSSTPPQVKTTTIDPVTGSYTIDTTGMQKPFILRATDETAGITLHSFANGAGTANINPLSESLVSGASEGTTRKISSTSRTVRNFTQSSPLSRPPLPTCRIN